jgi:hypothetical protein
MKNSMPQSFNTFFAQNVKPFELTNIKISGPPVGSGLPPFLFSLGANSTVPFIRLQGSGVTQKEFTWGETIKIPEGVQVQVQSASYGVGDIQLQSGQDICNKPARITIPIELPEPTFEGFYAPGDVIVPIYPCDVRLAKRAFVAAAWQTGDSGAGRVRVKGFSQQHSYAAAVRSAIQQVDPTGKKYITDVVLATVTLYGMFPLGFNWSANDPEFPHTLLDYATFELHMDNGGFESPAQLFYVVEYV